MASLFKVEELEVKYHTREGVLTAIQGLNFDVEEGQIVGIVGESGCGKSTVASAVMRLLPPNGEISQGRLLLRGQDILAFGQEQMRQFRGKEFSMIFQDPMTSLNPVLTVEDQMVDALRAHQSGPERNNRSALRKWAVDMLERVGIPDADRQIKEYPHQFSGGMRQRIIIANALLSHPSLLVADEPTSALDVTLEAQIIDLIRGLRDELGTAILYITHDLGLIAQLCDRVLVMYAGSIVESGDVYSMFESPRHPYSQALLRSHPSLSMRAARLKTIRGRVPSLRELPAGCKFAPRCDYERPICDRLRPEDAWVDWQTVLCHAYHPGWDGASPRTWMTMPEAEPETLAPEQKRPEPETTIIQTRELRTHFQDHTGLLGQILGQKGGTVRAVDGVDVEIRRGTTLALVGESGSGKTTLGRTILRLERPTDGDILIEGRDVTKLSQGKFSPMRARMQMIFQDPASSLSPRMKVSTALLEPFRIHNIPADKGKVDELLRMVGLSSEQADKYPHQLSGGQARRVGIARALALQPDILIADEPTAGLDVSVAASILNLLKDLREQLDLTYIIISHNLNVVSFIADRVAVMYLGKVVELADTETLFTEPRHPYTEALLSAIPVPDPRLRDRRRRIIPKGEIPSPRNPPPGCPFHPRCRYADARCAERVPPLRAIDGDGHSSACHYPERVDAVLEWQSTAPVH
jgi:peptide/nickel transport system ATP-binding protein